MKVFAKITVGKFTFVEDITQASLKEWQICNSPDVEFAYETFIRPIKCEEKDFENFDNPETYHYIESWLEDIINRDENLLFMFTNSNCEKYIFEVYHEE